jgi:antitoxin component HigA of HigAB toxin-antitoxin module
MSFAMKIRPIKTKADHRVALKEIERLMDAKPGTPAGDRLEILATLVDHYESQHEPIERAEDRGSFRPPCRPPSALSSRW